MWNTIRQQLNSQYLQSRFGKTLTWHSQMAKNAFVVYTFRYLITSRSIVGICHTKMRNLIMMPYFKTRNSKLLSMMFPFQHSFTRSESFRSSNTANIVCNGRRGWSSVEYLAISSLTHRPTRNSSREFFAHFFINNTDNCGTKENKQVCFCKKFFMVKFRL